MFTGIIKYTGNLVSIIPEGLGGEIRIDISSKFAAELDRKSQISVNGRAMTVLSKQDSSQHSTITFFQSRIKSIDSQKIPIKVNLERSIFFGEEIPSTLFYGIPSGHGEITVMEWLEQERLRLTIFWNTALLKYLDVKDQVCLDGVLLLIKQISNNAIVFEIYSETLKSTNLGTKNVGDSVNIEVDPIIAKISKVFERIQSND